MTKKERLYLIVFPVIFAAISLFSLFCKGDMVSRSDYEALQEKLAVAESDAQKWKCKAEFSRNQIVRSDRIVFDDLYLLARLVDSEAGGESYETKMMVASVVMNRVADYRFPDTIKSVIYQKGQFDVTEVAIDGVMMIDREPSLDSMRAANEVLNYGSVLPSNVLVFYRNGVKDEWVTSKTIHIISDHTVFSYLD